MRIHQFEGKKIPNKHRHLLNWSTSHRLLNFPPSSAGHLGQTAHLLCFWMPSCQTSSTQHQQLLTREIKASEAGQNRRDVWWFSFNGRLPLLEIGSAVFLKVSIIWGLKNKAWKVSSLIFRVHVFGRNSVFLKVSGNYGVELDDVASWEIHPIYYIDQ